MVRRIALLSALIAVTLAHTSAGSAGTFVSVLSPSGHSLATGSGPSFEYTNGAADVSISGVESLPGDTVLEEVQVLGGALELMHVDLFANGQVAIGNVIVGGRVVTRITPNMLIPLGAGAYAVVDQTARIAGRTGRLALRLVMSDVAGVAHGTEVIVGLSAAPGRADSTSRVDTPLAVLGFTAAVGAAVNFDAAPDANAGPIGERAVAIAERYLGVPYVWGGASPFTGFDCSGLALYVYAQLGVTLTHYTGAQLQEGLPVDRVAPGDLVFFEPNTAGVPQHEGIYIGDGKFIQAPHTGDVVKISSLDDPANGLALVGSVRPYVR